MAYQRHDKDRIPTGKSLLDINAYVRHDSDNIADVTQPTTNTVTDPYGNQYLNWNGDYVRSPLTPPNP